MEEQGSRFAIIGPIIGAILVYILISAAVGQFSETREDIRRAARPRATLEAPVNGAAIPAEGEAPTEGETPVDAAADTSTAITATDEITATNEITATDEITATEVVTP